MMFKANKGAIAEILMSHGAWKFSNNIYIYI